MKTLVTGRKGALVSCLVKEAIAGKGY